MEKKQLIFNLTDMPFRVHEIAKAILTSHKQYFTGYEYNVIVSTKYERDISHLKKGR